MSTLQQNWRKGQNRFCLEVRREVERGRGAGGRNDPNNVCTYKYMNKEKKIGKVYMFSCTELIKLILMVCVSILFSI
jgi:hypothetical protein